ncbi:MAG TPA: hypothetical protein VFV73_06280 [Streptosporangiaceae bacterium]|nr:hypothetical protein [Streptosporangiaceae bacterium]
MSQPDQSRQVSAGAVSSRLRGLLGLWPDGFLTSFAGTVVPAGQDSGQVPVVTGRIA